MLTVAIEDRVAIVTLDRPQRRNALSVAMMRELMRALGEIGENREVAAVILAANGPVFCSGHDLSEMTGREEAEYSCLFEVCTELMATVQGMAQPVIAEVQGMATAAGCQLVATCDLAIAAETALFATPGVKIGLFCSTPMVAVSRSIGPKRAMWMLLTGEAISAERAVEWGLINSAVPAGELRRATLALARKIAEASTVTVCIGKQTFYRQAGMEQPEAYEVAKDAMTRNALEADAQEGIGAFLGKRKPVWAGR